MSTLTSYSSRSLELRLPSGAGTGVYTARRHFDGTRGLAALLMAALVAAMVVVADHLISTWADGHLLLAWVLLWMVIFASLALFASTARQLARRTLHGLDNWARGRAEARAEARLWEMARHDPRLMSELVQARMREIEDRDTAASAAGVDGFDAALAPLGMDVYVSTAGSLSAQRGWDRFVGRMAAQRRPNLHLHYL
jgi:hypothetical protein